MAHHVDLSVRPNRAFMQFGGIQLKCFTSSEVPKISVLEVTQTNTFDEAGFPVRGGLYDPFLGTSENNHCETCGMQGSHCPGHFGHIRLTVPVFNPLFYSFAFNMMKGTCIHCHRFTCNTNSLAAKVIIAKLRAFHFGVPEVLDKVESGLRAKFEKGDELLTERIDLVGENVFLREIDAFIAKLKGVSNADQLLKMERRGDENVQLKNDAAERNAIVKTFVRDHLFKRKARCPHCKQPNGELRNDSGRTFLLDFAKQTGAERKKREAIKNRLGEATFNKLLNDAKNLDETKTFISTTTENDRPDLGFVSVDIDEAEFAETKLGKAPAISSNTLIDPLEISDKLLNEQLRNVISGHCDKLAWRAAEVREHFRLVWQRESIVIRHLFPFFDEGDFTSVDDSKSNMSLNQFPVDSLFIETVIVEPSRYRPVRRFKGERFEHPTTVNLRKLLEADQLLALIRIHLDEEKGGKPKLGNMAKELIEGRILGKTMNEKLHNAYMDLQMRTNALFDRAANRVDSKGSQPGLKQLLEKKEGLFRMHMMGKRVNFACRSVITPDPYLDIDEIGIPELFACRLTFPEPLSSLNHRLLKEFVRRGPNNHPGANFVEFSGTIGKPPTRIKVPFEREAARERGYLSTKLRFGDVSNVHAMPDYVLRHLQNGDKLLMNRQPSLHKPSIMGHRARVLTGQNALRMNYAPCKAYNADFDGDEMNGHFIQNRIAQCEASELANVGNNYLVPKDGTPILGLIQDHVVAGVLMTIRGFFFEREDFMHLILAAFAQTKQRLHIPKPTIILPTKLWSGKQVITAIVLNCCPSDRPLINLDGKAKTGTACWKTRDPITGKERPTICAEMNESEVIFRQGELLCGVLDKAHYGATQFGLIHCCYELYGPKVAVQILSCFSRVFTTFLQLRGFTLGVTDILVTRRADRERKKAIRELLKCGDAVACKTFGLAEGTPPDRIRNALASAYNHPRSDRSMVKLYDFVMKQTLNKYSEQINNVCVPFGLIREFPHNSLQLMIQSGAKGSLVNSIQISCALGQIELEGQRPPRSVTGRSLPSFRSFDPTPRAGGFVSQRFLTGINPQELFFHTMAGREGLIDTAVKTSRSGYLQRCIIKHLEGLAVRYDHTVRDFDDSVVQFRYGEDGMDVGRATFLDPKLFQFLSQNADIIRQNSIPSGVTDGLEREQWNLTACEKQFIKISKFKRRRMRKMQMDGNLKQSHPITSNKGYRDSSFLEFCRHREANELKQSLVAEWSAMAKENKAEFALKHPRAPTPVDAKFCPWVSLGALPERMLEQLEEFISKKCQTEKGNGFRKVISWKGLRALVDPGENVGLLAAQSIGEPSTQMTLNTFHFAGRGEMNVTLGIPRLREILMTQSKNISTPLAEVCFYPDVSDDQVEQIKAEMNPVLLRTIIKKFVLEETIFVNENGNFLREYSLHIALLDSSRRDPSTRHLEGRRILTELERRFGRQMAMTVAKRYKEVQDYQQIQHKKLRVNALETDPEEGSHRPRQEEGDLESDEEEAAGGVRSREADANEAKLSRRHLDDAADYEGEEQDRNDAGIDEMEKEEDNEEEMAQQEGGDEATELDESRERRIMEGRSTEINTDRIKSVLGSHAIIGGYEYDAQNEQWCTFKFHMPFSNKTRIDVLAIAEREIEWFVLTQVHGIEKCNVREEQRNGRTVRVLQTQGINLGAFYAHANLLDINTIYSNDIDFMLRNFGIEAAGRTISREMNSVFGVYGIEVNPRHLILTADYMTFTGEVQPFSRGAMADSASPLQKMTFETTVTFMREALISGQFDSLSSPSARLVTGQMVRCGTGAFELLSESNYTMRGAKKGSKRGHRK